jgi:hypothetical protein
MECGQTDTPESDQQSKSATQRRSETQTALKTYAVVADKSKCQDAEEVGLAA